MQQHFLGSWDQDKKQSCRFDWVGSGELAPSTFGEWSLVSQKIYGKTADLY